MHSSRLVSRHLRVLLWLMVTCTGSGQGTDLFRCGFENGICNSFIQSRDDDFYWSLGSQSTQSSGTGPSAPYNGSHYIYIDAYGRTPSKVAAIQTRDLEYNGTVCVTFAYHMFGADIGSLVVSNTGLSTPIWSRIGDQGNLWHLAAVRTHIVEGKAIKLSATTSSIQNGYRGDIAVDSVVVLSGSCESSVALPFTCSFESDICDMFQRDNDMLDWTRLRGATGTSQTGPSAALDGVYYIYLEADGPAYGLDTPKINHSGPVCLRFNYHMYGQNIGSLNVWQQNENSIRSLFDHTGQQGDSWMSATVTVSDLAAGDWITFVGQRGNGNKGDIAIDNISLTAEECNACLLNNGGCEHTCHRTDAGRYCTCQPGYTPDGDTRCVDIDECGTNRGGCHRGCSNTAGSYTCYCDRGFRVTPQDDHRCEDVNECDENNGGCERGCNNTEGGYVCYCPEGYRLLQDGHNCTDINECAEETDGCSHVCDNTHGSYKCSCPREKVLADDGHVCLVTECPGFYGTNCSKKCHCAEGKNCHPSSGSCPGGLCEAGRRGDACVEECVPGTYGENCEYQCHCDSNDVCDVISGRCPSGDCAVGWMGESCSDMCSDGTFGSRCSRECHCQGPPCDVISGVCPKATCAEGYTGETCSDVEGPGVAAIAGGVAGAVIVVIVLVLLLLRRRSRQNQAENDAYINAEMLRPPEQRRVGGCAEMFKRGAGKEENPAKAEATYVNGQQPETNPELPGTTGSDTGLTSSGSEHLRVNAADGAPSRDADPDRVYEPIEAATRADESRNHVYEELRT